MIAVDDLLKPLSDDAPCGPDLAYDPAFQELETLVRGKPETQFSAAEEPNWKELRTAAIEFHGRSKHLTASVILALAQLKLEAFPGFRDGLAVVRGLLERHWDNLYPRLDPDDNNDPTERMNLLANLASNSEPYLIIPRLKDTPVAQSPSLGRVKLSDIIAAKGPSGTPAEGQPATLTEGQINAIFRDTNAEGLKVVYDAVLQSAEHIKAIDTFLNGKVGTRGANLDELSQCFKQLQGAIAPYVGGAPAEGAADAAAGGEAGVAAGGTVVRQVVAVPGSITSREDVVKTLDRVCEYYAKNEPSSPVPLLLRRAQRIAKMNFLEIVNDLTPDAMGQLRMVAGRQENESSN